MQTESEIMARAKALDYPMVVVGGSATRDWASFAALPGYHATLDQQLTALEATRRQMAERSARAAETHSDPAAVEAAHQRELAEDGQDDLERTRARLDREDPRALQSRLVSVLEKLEGHLSRR